MAATTATRQERQFDLRLGADQEEPAPRKASRQLLPHEIEGGIDALERPLSGLFGSRLSAGLDIGFSLFLMAVMTTWFAGIGVPEFARFLLWVTLGNITGGVVFVAFVKYGLARPGAQVPVGADHGLSPPKGRSFMAKTAQEPYGRRTQREPAVKEVHVLWITAGLSCDGDSVSVTAASQPSIEEIVMGAIPGLPKVHLHNPVLAYEVGDEFMESWYKADEGRLGAPFVLVIEGSIPNERIKSEGYWAALGTDRKTGQPITTCEWIDRLAPKAWAVVAAGTCATFGGIHAMAGNPTGAMGLADYLGWSWRSQAGVPIVNVPGCPVQPDNMTETLLYLLYQAAGLAPMIPLDRELRPTWLFGKTVHEGCDRGSYYEQGDFANEYGSPKCLVRLGCWGPVVNCNVTKRGWMAGIGGCPNVGGICIGCTMPGFPDKFMPFLDEPPGGVLSSGIVKLYGNIIRRLRSITNATVNQEPRWRHRAPVLTTGYHPTTYGPEGRNGGIS